MSRSSHRNLLILLGLVAAACSALCVADLMRETDQGSLLTGSWRLFRGDSLFGQRFYNYDKQYGTYWLIAIGYWIRSAAPGDWSAVKVANISTATSFWACTLASLFLASRRRRLPSMVVLVCFVTCPVVLINAVYANCAMVSAGFLILSGVLLEEFPWLGVGCFFLAVAARGDAVLLAPLLTWIGAPSRGWLKKAFTRRITWAMVLAAIAAIGIGILAYSGERQYADLFDPMFQGKMLKAVGAFAVFGLGPLLAIEALLLVCLAVTGLHATGADKKFFYLSGAFCVAIPLLYYSLQMYSPRYLVTAVCSLVIFFLSRRGTAFWRLCIRNPFTRRSSWAAAAVGTGMLVFGLRLPTPRHPRITVSNPTLYPTTDGLHPTGAYLSFMRRMRSMNIDHNQLIWRAARQAEYVPAADGKVHILFTPMYAYLELAVTVKGLEPLKEVHQTDTRLYADSRSFTRLGSGMEGSPQLLNSFLAKPASFVSPVSDGFGILYFGAGPGDAGDLKWGRQARLLNRLFRANEYRILNRSSHLHDVDFDGRPFTFMADQPFRISVDSGKNWQIAVRDELSGTYFVPLYRVANPSLAFAAEDPNRIELVRQALPAWMSVDKQ